MSKNPDTIHLFVKGNKGSCAFIITEPDGTEIFDQIISGLKDSSGNDLHQTHADWEAVILGLEYIQANRGKGKIPRDPSVKIFTTFEPVYQTAVTQTNPSSIPDIFKRYDNARKALRRSTATLPIDNNVKASWVPNNFVNKMDDLDSKLKNKPGGTKLK